MFGVCLRRGKGYQLASIYEDDIEGQKRMEVAKDCKECDNSK
tara:strand:+ start:102 stop:227 length:126 start_codon:yes stop_codon:yes gene_type:complete